MSTTPQSKEGGCWTLTAPQVAELLQISERHVWYLNASGHIPRPIRLGQSTRWILSELRSWLDAGSPDREAWEAVRDGRRP